MPLLAPLKVSTIIEELTGRCQPERSQNRIRRLTTGRSVLHIRVDCQSIAHLLRPPPQTAGARIVWAAHRARTTDFFRRSQTEEALRVAVGDLLRVRGAHREPVQESSRLIHRSV